jgi:hypothetical protein
MVIPASQVRLLCVGPEIALVRASRKPEIEQLSKVELKRHAVRARKLLDKWRSLGRGQSRDQRKATGSSDTAKNTRVKKQIFRDALDAFEAQLAKPATSTPKATKPIPPTSKERSSQHRATRAATRKGLTFTEDLLNAKVAKKKPASLKPAKPKPSSAKPAADSNAVPPAAKPSEKAKPSAAPRAKVPVAKKVPPKAIATSVTKQRAAITAAKQSRVVRSGKTTRLFGHVSARGKRAQARRDTKR